MRARRSSRFGSRRASISRGFRGRSASATRSSPSTPRTRCRSDGSRRSAMRRRHDRRTDRGSTIPLIVGFVGVLIVAGAVVVDATAAFLQRQGLDTLADGAALRGADLGAQGLEVYAGGLGADRLTVSEPAARTAVAGYLAD